MNKREKKLMIATMAMVLIGAVALLSRGDDPPKKTAEAVAPAETKKRRSTPAPKNSDPDDSTSLTVFVEDLQSFLQLHQTRKDGVVEEDPFRSVEPVVIAPIVVDSPTETNDSLPTPPKLTGMYLAGSSKGALLDGKVCFEGHKVGVFTLVEVTPTGVRLRFEDRELVILYDPAKRD